LSDETLAEKFSPGVVYKVGGIKHSYADMGDQVLPVIKVRGELHEVYCDYRIKPELRAGWAVYLSTSIMLAVPVFFLMFFSHLYNQLPAAFKQVKSGDV
jgi:hypothetical protein